MGLDMYLEKRTYVGNKYRMPSKQVKVVIPKNQKGVSFPTEKIESKRITSIVEEVGYWRKANAIHNWFVNNVQEGNDDCKDYEVSQEQLKELLDLCNRVLVASKLIKSKITNGYNITKNGREAILEDGMKIEDSKVAMELLPVASGFFFGGTDYDQYYYEDIKHTKEILVKAIKEGGDYYYNSSW